MPYRARVLVKNRNQSELSELGGNGHPLRHFQPIQLSPEGFVRLNRADGRELDEGEEVGGVFLIARRNTAAVLDPVEEPFDMISVAVEIRTEADGIAPVSTGWDVRPTSTHTHDFSYLGRVVSLVGENHSAAR